MGPDIILEGTNDRGEQVFAVWTETASAKAFLAHFEVPACFSVLSVGEAGAVEVSRRDGAQGFVCRFMRDTVALASQVLHSDREVAQFLERWLPRTVKAGPEAAR